MREDLREVFGTGLSDEQEEALLAMSEHIEYVMGEIGMADFKAAGRKLLKSLNEREGPDWRDDYYGALSFSLSKKADRYRGTRSVRSTLPAGLLVSAAQVDAWLDAQASVDADLGAKEREPRSAMVSVAEWGYERGFSWRSSESTLGELARAGEFLKGLGWEPAKARGYVLTGRVPAYSRVHGSVTWDTREFPFPRVSLSIDPSASSAEILAGFAAVKKDLVERVRPFSERALELHRHTSQLPDAPQAWRASYADWNARFHDVLWQYSTLREYKAAVRRVRESMVKRTVSDERSPVNQQKYLGGL